jgi:hypothetical protein
MVCRISGERRGGVKRSAYMKLTCNLEGKCLLVYPKCRLVDIIIVNIRVIGLGGVGWNDVVQNRSSASFLRIS